ncbi:hypothetical protein GM658_07590 [Pseudoduganella eburnea]|uniref:Uncharacterized protein n=1 Tax=Massilia eburnea TaxID=1776165 RepID=A0A6L6QEH0_9BURK|nr:hypothetical protein [Massilia eburnea]MTW10464.1 hypothetical protein [Massilia eburnea]
MNKRHFLLALAATIAFPALAQEAGREPRPFPPNAKRGRMTLGYAPDIIIDGKLRQLSPAARIVSEDNLSVVPGSLSEKDIPVIYTEDMNGNIDRVWILTPEEANMKAP